MAPSSKPKFLATANPSLQDLWENKRITDLTSLRSHCQDLTYFALDVEGSDTLECGITGVGLALVRDLFRTRETNAQTNLASIVREYAVEGHNIMTSNTRKRYHGRYEKSPFAKLHQSQEEGIDRTFCDILASANAQSFVMVVWGSQSEFLAIASTIPSAIRNISYWVDVQDLVANISATPAQKKPFSLRDTMLSLGFSHEHAQKLSRGHSAGMDAVRTMGVLIELCSRWAGTKSLVLIRHTKNKQARRKLWETRPKPRETFPFTIKMTTTKNIMPPSLQYSQNLLNYLRLSSYADELAAVAVCPPSHKKKPKTHAWVCFTNQRAMERFVKEWNGKQIDDLGLQVEVD
ncbi:hypothetical protein F4825DRAFT_453357 [Nemania diffusa]|nr:hypothetical protein F4825DRAFT_453357 [Nemania diffusa]